MLIPGVDGRNGVVKKSSRWPGGRIPFRFGNSVSSKDRAVIESAMQEYHKFTCLRFEPKTSSDSDFITFQSDSTGCWSSVGRVGREQVVNLQSPGCTYKVGTAIHEMMHAVGINISFSTN
jgi:hypothetical protein